MAVPSFLIKNGSSDFVNKQKNLFDLLETAEKETKSANNSFDGSMEIDTFKSNKRKRKETKPFKGKESLFKEPVDLPVGFKKNYKVPDFQRNPHKWVKYSLADVSQDDMSNESNTAAALSFLRDMKIQKKLKTIKKEPENDTKDLSGKLHKFQIPVKEEHGKQAEYFEEDREEQKKPVFKSSKLIMPEYVVGQVKKENKSLKKRVHGEKSKEVYLNHIHEYEDE